MYGTVNVGSGGIFPKAPALTAVTPSGSVVGTASWTGTGLYRSDSSSSWTNSAYSAEIGKTGYIRFDLKLAAGEDWQDWSPYYDCQGEEYPFYYSETRGLYEGIIPNENLTPAQVVDRVRWVYRRKPEQIWYGILSNAAAYFDGGSSVTVSMGEGPWLQRMLGIGEPTEYAEDLAFALSMGQVSLSKVPLQGKIKLALAADTNGDGIIDGGDVSYIAARVNTQLLMEVDTIDNWEE